MNQYLLKSFLICSLLAEICLASAVSSVAWLSLHLVIARAALQVAILAGWMCDNVKWLIACMYTGT